MRKSPPIISWKFKKTKFYFTSNSRLSYVRIYGLHLYIREGSCYSETDTRNTVRLVRHKPWLRFGNLAEDKVKPCQFQCWFRFYWYAYYNCYLDIPSPKCVLLYDRNIAPSKIRIINKFRAKRTVVYCGLKLNEPYLVIYMYISLYVPYWNTWHDMHALRIFDELTVVVHVTWIC